MTQHRVHNHDFDPGCRETEGPDGLLRGDCVRWFTVIEFTYDAAGNKLLVERYITKGTRMRDKIVSEILREDHGYTITETY